MSCATLNPVTASERQVIFDRLVASTGICNTAPAGDKIAALRSLSPKDLERLLLDNGNSLPAWDENFYVDQNPAISLEEGPFPSWAKIVVVGVTKDENAFFSQYWHTLDVKTLTRNMREAFSDRNTLRKS